MPTNAQHFLQLFVVVGFLNLFTCFQTHWWGNSIQASLFHLQNRFFYLHSWILTFHCPLPPHCWAPGQPWWSSPWLSWPHGTGAPTIETQQVELLEYRYVGRTFVKSGNTDTVFNESETNHTKVWTQSPASSFVVGKTLHSWIAVMSQ